jgi:CheY-like chemotaxis protein
MLKLLRRLIGEDISLAWLPGTGVWPVKVDPSQVDQVLANLCVNARDAIAGVGRIAIATRNAVLDAAYCAEHLGTTAGEYVLLAVSDTGCGMNAQTLAHLFEPFFTTKPMGHGTGLGLATVYGIVTQNGGHVSVQSEPGKGTTFSLYLPRHLSSAPREARNAARTTASRGGSETILVVEDEKAIRYTIRRFLGALGYTVIDAEAPDVALRQATAQVGPIHLLVTDVVMPGMSGRDLAERLTRERPEMACLYMSGYTADAIVQRGILEEGMHFLPKPFTREELAHKVREVLDGVPRPRAQA